MLNSCKDEAPGPFFGNGFHNGWADQNSIVIWTRLTVNPEMNRMGPPFIIPSDDDHRKLDIEANPDSIYKAQIPEGYLLDQMVGACPGAKGEVKLVCYPLRNREMRIEKDWTQVSEDRNYTVQWKLERLIPDTKYVVELEARANSKSVTRASLFGSFRTPPEKDSVRSIDFCIVTCHDYPRRDDQFNGHKITQNEFSFLELTNR